jgi:hypothetical protein
MISNMFKDTPFPIFATCWGKTQGEEKRKLVIKAVEVAIERVNREDHNKNIHHNPTFRTITTNSTWMIVGLSSEKEKKRLLEIASVMHCVTGTLIFFREVRKSPFYARTMIVEGCKTRERLEAEKSILQQGKGIKKIEWLGETKKESNLHIVKVLSKSTLEKKRGDYGRDQ